MIARPVPFTSLARPERIDSVPFTQNSILRVGGGGLLPSDRWYWGLVCVFEGRITNPASGGPSAFTADGLPSIIERFTVQGYHRIRQQNQTFFDLRGADCKVLGDYYSGLSLFSEPTGYNFSGSASNDCRVYYVLPFVPCNVGPLTAGSYLLDAPNYDALQFTIQCGDLQNVFASFSTAPTLSAYGSSTGSPVVRVNGLFALAGASRFSGQLPGRVFFTHQEYTDSRMTTTAQSVRLHDIVRGNFVRALTLKTGIKKTGVTAGNNAYSTLSNTVLSNIRVFRGINSIVRDYPLYHDIREEDIIAASMSGGSSNFRLASGYARIDWAKHGLLGESFDARPLVAGPTGQVDFYLAADVTGVNNQGLVVMTEEIRWAPGQP
jgi:hypothetical protein